MFDALKPNESQVAAAQGILQQYVIQNGATSTVTHQRQAIYAIFAVLTGRLSAVPAQYQANLKNVDLGEAPVEEASEADDVDPIPSEYHRARAILEGMVFDPEQRTLAISAEAAAQLTGDGQSDFPEAGLYITYASAGAMVEQVMQQAADPATIVGKQVREAIAAETAEPNGDDKAAVNFDGMTVAALKEFATENSVELAGVSTKAEIIARLREFGF